MKEHLDHYLGTDRSDELDKVLRFAAPIAYDIAKGRIIGQLIAYALFAALVLFVIVGYLITSTVTSPTAIVLITLSPIWIPLMCSPLHPIALAFLNIFFIQPLFF